MSDERKKSFVFRVLVEHIQNVYVATCLETSHVATADSQMDVTAKMAKMLVRQVAFALKNDNPADIYHSAPNDIWDKFMADDNGFLGDTKYPVSLDHTNVTVQQLAFGTPAA